MTAAQYVRKSSHHFLASRDGMWQFYFNLCRREAAEWMIYMARRLGSATLELQHAPAILSFAAVGGKMEGEGPLGSQFDKIDTDTTFGEDTWEKAESLMQKDAVNLALKKGQLQASDLHFVFAGDLLNQCISSTYGLRDLGVPFIGLYGACSTMAESLTMASLFVEAGFAQKAAALTSSHFCSAERQFRFPLEYGGQRPPTAQWTATASGAVVVGEKGNGPYVRAVTIGKIKDLGITDANNMGAAMAPAAADTLRQYFLDTDTKPADYDMIVTGDLGAVGADLFIQLMGEDGKDLKPRYNDCGLLIYDRNKQTEVDAGGSGCGCSASVLCSYLLPALRRGDINELLFMATGALMSPTSVQQGESIPGIAHLLRISTKAE